MRSFVCVQKPDSLLRDVTSLRPERRYKGTTYSYNGKRCIQTLKVDSYAISSTLKLAGFTYMDCHRLTVIHLNPKLVKAEKKLRLGLCGDITQ